MHDVLRAGGVTITAHAPPDLGALHIIPCTNLTISLRRQLWHSMQDKNIKWKYQVHLK